MNEQTASVGAPARAHPSPEEPMLREDRVRELLARLQRGEGVKSVARKLGADRKTVRAGLSLPRPGPVLVPTRRAQPHRAPPRQLSQTAPSLAWFRLTRCVSGTRTRRRSRSQDPSPAAVSPRGP